MKCPCLWDEYKLSQRMCKNKTIVPAQQKKVYFNFSGSPTKLIPLSKEEGEKNTRVNFFFALSWVGLQGRVGGCHKKRTHGADWP